MPSVERMRLIAAVLGFLLGSASPQPATALTSSSAASRPPSSSYSYHPSASTAQSPSAGSSPMGRRPESAPAPSVSTPPPVVAAPPSPMGRRPTDAFAPLPAQTPTPPNPAPPISSAMGRRPGEAPTGPVSVPSPAPSAVQSQPRDANASAMGRRPGEASAPTAQTSAPPVRQGALAAASSKQASTAALQRFEADKARAKMPAAPLDAAAAQGNPIWNQTRSKYGSIDDYYSDRDRSMSSFRERYPDTASYAQSLRPHYGAWDGFFMGMLLSDLTRHDNADWAYAHQSDPGYVQWHRDAMEQSEKNAEMRERIARLDQQVADLKARGTAPQAQDVLPEGVSPAVALAPEAMMVDGGNGKKSRFWTHVAEAAAVGVVLVIGFLVGLHLWVRRMRTAR